MVTGLRCVCGGGPSHPGFQKAPEWPHLLTTMSFNPGAEDGLSLGCTALSTEGLAGLLSSLRHLSHPKSGCTGGKWDDHSQTCQPATNSTLALGI